MLSTVNVNAAENTPLLIITDDRVGVLDEQNGDYDPALEITRYYELLGSSEKQEALNLRRELVDLIPDYDVAFAAADTAEINSVLSAIAYRWAVLRTFHAEHFTDAAREALFRAYTELYLLLQ